MDKQDVFKMQEIINEYGERGALQCFIRALYVAADQAVDMGLKERAVTQVELAGYLEEVEDALDDTSDE